MTVPKLHHFVQQTITSTFPVDKQRNLKPWSKQNVTKDTEVIQELVQFSRCMFSVLQFSTLQQWDSIISKGEHTILPHVG